MFRHHIEALHKKTNIVRRTVGPLVESGRSAKAKIVRIAALSLLKFISEWVTVYRLASQCSYSTH